MRQSGRAANLAGAAAATTLAAALVGAAGVVGSPRALSTFGAPDAIAAGGVANVEAFSLATPAVPIGYSCGPGAAWDQPQPEPQPQTEPETGAEPGLDADMAETDQATVVDLELLVAAAEPPPTVAGGWQPRQFQAAEGIEVKGLGNGSYLVAAPDQPSDTPLFAAGSAAYWATGGAARGLAARRCEPAAFEHWLFGGASNPGDTTILRVTNVSGAPATVALSVFGPSGPVHLGTRGQFLVAGGETVELPLDSMAPSLSRFAVRLNATGTPVVADLALSTQAGLHPGGVGYAQASTAPSSSIYIPGIRAYGDPADSDGAPRLQLLSAEANATARATVVGEQGPVVTAAVDIDLPVGVLVEVPLGGFPAGDYAVVVESDAPVTGAVRWQRSDGAATDFAVAPAAPLLADGAVLVPAGLDASIVAIGAAPEPVAGVVSPSEVALDASARQAAVIDIPVSPEPQLITVTAVAGMAWGVILSVPDNPTLVSTVAATPALPKSGGITLRPVLVR